MLGVSLVTSVVVLRLPAVAVMILSLGRLWNVKIRCLSVSGLLLVSRMCSMLSTLGT